MATTENEQDMPTEEEDLAVLISNLKTRTIKQDPLKVARSCRRLRDLYGSYAEVAKKVSLDSHEMLREFEALLSLPTEVRNLYKSGILKSVVVGYWISRMKRNNEDKKRLANAVVRFRLTAQNVRDAVKYAERKRSFTMRKVIDMIRRSNRFERHYLIVAKLQDGTLQMLQKISRERKVEPAFLIRQAIGETLRSKEMLSSAVEGNLITMRLNEGGFRAMQSRSEAAKMELEAFTENVIVTWLRSNFGRRGRQD